MQVVGAVVQEFLHQPVGARIGDVLVIVEDQVELPIHRCRAFDYGGDKMTEGVARRRIVGQVAVDAHAEALHSLGQVDEEGREVLVVGPQR
ncbi:hypothetical protein D3C80_1563790 [compost metagenome]